MIVYDREVEYPYTSILQYKENYSCFWRFIPYLGAMLWYVVM